MPLPLTIGMLHKTDPAVVADIDRLLDDHTEGAIAAMLAAREVLTGGGVEFARLGVRAVRIAYHLRPRYERLRARGYLTLQEMADHLHVDPSTVKIWRRHGLLTGDASDNRGNYLYPPNQRAPRKHAWKFGRHAWRVTRIQST